MIMIRETFLTYVISISSDDKFFFGGGGVGGGHGVSLLAHQVLV